ncbi:putative UPF0480 protein [Hirsutella rhossiliensis]|uniref:UPF0480 protein n=1 Tax=Hirsutella rhossiliensis TaxID=111463 RepID=A0A9P8N5P5_9HYPO|nr:putative UPF0480 protein [Hirsutella rhossiliensis]KAH0966431.1 putative UPF0480 protein [Hirsutella rhossiliensis]
MRLDSSALLASFALCVSASASSPSPSPSPSPSSHSVTLYLPASPNPFALAARTHATLASLGAHYTAPLSAVNTFVFHNVTPGSYLADVHCPSEAFRPLRIDVGGGPDAPGGTVAAWETFRGNDWANKGEALPVRDGSVGAGFELRHLGGKNYFLERPGFSVLTILKNPMILMGAVSMIIFIGMPYLMENMDPDMKAEFEEQQRKGGPVAAMMGGGQAAGNPLGEFDMAAFLAGSKKKDGSSAGDAGGEGPAKQQGVRR